MQTHAWFLDEFIDGGSPDIRFCEDEDECGLDAGIEYTKEGLWDNVVTDRTASEYIQDIIIYILMFVSIIAVIYIIWAGFQILTGNGDEEKLKKARTTIIYVLLWIVLIWLAWPITNWLIGVLNN